MTGVFLPLAGMAAGLSMLSVAAVRAGSGHLPGADTQDRLQIASQIAPQIAQATKKKRRRKPAPVTIVPEKAPYVILRDINVRRRPDTKSKRIGRFKKGTLIQSTGRARGTGWIQVRTDKIQVGFVYSAMVAPLIDGALKSNIEGRLARPGLLACRYTIEFEGKSQIEKELQRTADYAVPFACTLAGKPLNFTATMFLTELPYRESGPPIYQINVDLRDMPLEGEDVLTVIALYNTKKAQVSFDTVNDKSFGSGAKIAPKNAAGLDAALKAAIEIAYASWGKAAWEQLAPGN
ncbi:MAG: SH3 domain-containing protein [Rhodospirillales bacterium]